MAVAPQVPFNSRIITDPAYIVTQSFTTGATGGVSGTTPVSASTPALDLVQAVPYPTTEKIIVSVLNTALSNVTGSNASAGHNIWLQDSSDNTTFTNVAIFANPLIRLRPSGATTTVAASSVNVLLPPTINRYVRAQAIANPSASLAGGPTGSFGVTVYF